MKNIEHIKNKIKNKIKNTTIPIKLLEFIKWKLIDLYRLIKYPQKPHLYGIRCIVGMYGSGKTMTMAYLALKYRKKYGDKIYITSNFGLAIQDFAFNDLEQLTIQYDKPIIFFFDEAQMEFPSSDRVLPKPVRQALSLNRKGNGKMIYWASQDEELVHKGFRRLTIEYLQVKTLFKRYTRIRTYLAMDYEQMRAEVDVNKKRKIKPIWRESYIQSDYIRSLYNSFGWDNGEKLKDNLGLKSVKK